ncbi:MAG: ABC transporter permease [Lachnospiraceae bacterium]|nr:ABC transporter permease [Lachnospiraceae bacterium]
MKSASETEMTLISSDGNTYNLVKNADNIYSLYATAAEKYATKSGSVKYANYSTIGAVLTYEAGAEEIDGLADKIKEAISSKTLHFTIGSDEFTLVQDKKNYTVYRASEGFDYLVKEEGDAFEELVSENAEGGRFTYKNEEYTVTADSDGITVYHVTGQERIALLTTYVFDAYDPSFKISEEFEVAALMASIESGEFSADGNTYRVVSEDDETLIYNTSDETNPVAAFSTMVIRRYSGEDTLELAFKEKAREVIDEMAETGAKTGKFTWPIAQVDADGAYTYDENGELIKEDREVTINSKNDSYVMTVEQVVYLIDTFARPTSQHLAGTDGDGMDVLARMMYGGRVSLMVAFVVVILENVLGIIMGGIAGFFGGWVDNIIMRAVDIFYCIPSMPILIIMGAMFDAMKLKPYTRLVWMMVVLGVLGWAGVARLVRGQILSLREQEFMVAAEAIGLKNSKRIFRHLIPNVMPQLIVTATSGLGGVIITESTLSYLGLGVKHPLASWGTMINSVSTAEAMKSYTYIWIPVGLLICLTVVAFNFVGDGLRDAFDPKMKR